jgi:hypothetical protein
MPPERLQKQSPSTHRRETHFWLRAGASGLVGTAWLLELQQPFAYHRFRNCPLSDRCSASQKMYEKYHYTDHQQNVNEAGRNVKGKESQ